MRLLVLGGTAWLGSTVAAEAAGRGHEVVCLARGESGTTPAGVRFVRGDRTTSGGYAALDGEFDALVDVARDPLHVRTAIDALSDRVRHWVFVSTCSVYADESTPGSDESAALREPLAPGSAWSLEVYGEGKVACEQHLRAGLGDDRVLVARAGLIAGPGDPSGRTGYWPLRLARPAVEDGSVLVPDEPTPATQQLDVRDLAGWLVDSAESGLAITANAIGESVPWPEYLALARKVAGHDGPLVRRSPDWLVDQGVAPWSGPRSLPLWLPMPEYAGFTTRSDTRALETGLRRRPLAETLHDVLAWELQSGPERERGAGLTVAEERELLAL